MTLFLLAFSLLHATLFGSDCSLKNPIPLPKCGITTTPVTIRKLVTDTPRFIHPELYAEGDVLYADLFKITWNDNETKYMGAKIGIEGKLESVGFSPMYYGTFNVTGSTTYFQGKTTYYTHYTFVPEGPQHAPGTAITDVTILVENNAIVAILLKHPIFTSWKKSGFAEYLAFTGEHQNLCVYDAEWK